jgi:hypothetical protein
MDTQSRRSAEVEAVAPRSPSPRRPHHPAILGLGCAVSLTLAACLLPAQAAQLPGIPSDETERAWYTAFMARFNARVIPSFGIDAELATRVSSAWDAMVLRLTGGKGTHPTPLDQYPLLSFVDDRFLVMKFKDARGKESFVVRDDEGPAVPTLSTSLASYLDEVVFASLRAIAEEERLKLVERPGYEPRLEQLAAQNPFQHRLPIRVPEMGPFKNRMVAFTGPGGRLSATDTAEYEQRKWEGGRQVIGIVRDQQWGVAVELADLMEEGRLVCRYRLVREVAAVRDSFVGEGRRGVLLRQPRLGAVIEVSGCVAGCEQRERWTLIYPEPDKRVQPSSPLRRQPRLPEVADPSMRGGAMVPALPWSPPS